MNLQELKDSKKLRNQLKFGLTLALDYNEERQLDYAISSKNKSLEKKSDADENNSFSLFVDTISKTFLKIFYFNFQIFRSC